MSESTPKRINLRHGAIKRIAHDLAVAPSYVGRVLAGRGRVSPELALQMLGHPELAGNPDATLARLSGLIVPPGTPLGGGLVALQPPSRGEAPIDAYPLTEPLPLDGVAL